MADMSLFSRVRTKRNNSKKLGKNSKKTTRRATAAIWRIFAELNNPRCTVENELKIVGGKHVLAMFLNKELF